MSSNPVSDAFAALESAVEALGALDWASLPVGEQLGALDRLETVRRKATACAGDLVLAAVRCGDEALGGVVHKVIADVIRVSPAEARRRARDAAQLCPRTTLTGQALPPVLPATAKAWHAGVMDPAHLRTIQKFVTELPDHIDPVEVARAEEFLAEQAAALRTDQLDKVAALLAITINPDGTFTDEDRARHRGFAWGPQRPDGMSVGRLSANPELRSMLDAWLAKFAAPGMCNPADQKPCITGEPSEERAAADERTHSQRQHDALAALVRGQLGDPTLGQHRGLPVTVVVSATLEQLQTGAGHGVTGGGTLLPMADLIRMASHAWHYLCVYDTHSRRPIYLGRSKRIATADQRVVLHARDRGCTAPGCPMPGYLTEVHHTTPWAAGGNTDADQLTFACKPHHRLLDNGWTTRTRNDGHTEWLPPPHLPLKPATNTFHHPEQFLPRETRN